MKVYGKDIRNFLKNSGFVVSRYGAIRADASLDMASCYGSPCRFVAHLSYVEEDGENFVASVSIRSSGFRGEPYEIGSLKFRAPDGDSFAAAHLEVLGMLARFRLAMGLASPGDVKEEP